jgi:hypothetical protein
MSERVPPKVSKLALFLLSPQKKVKDQKVKVMVLKEGLA